MTNCAVCNRHVSEDRVVLHRVNEKGIPGIFVCEPCLTPEQRAALDPETKHLTDTLRQDQYNKDQQ